MAVRLSLANADLVTNDGQSFKGIQFSVFNGQATARDRNARRDVASRAGVVSIEVEGNVRTVLFDDGTRWVATRQRNCGCGA